MKPNLLPYDVRKLVVRCFKELGVSMEEPWALAETLLVDEGRCAARSYTAGALMAMWLLDVGIVQFYDAEGNMLRTVNLADESESQRMAA